jgi:hypothetical protein
MWSLNFKKLDVLQSWYAKMVEEHFSKVGMRLCMSISIFFGMLEFGFSVSPTESVTFFKKSNILSLVQQFQTFFLNQ